MIQLPKIPKDPEKVKGLCQCRPICKSRRREWKGQIQSTSAELILERKPLPECFRRWPKKVFPNGPCPLYGRTPHITIKERNAYLPPPTVVRVCQAPIDDLVDTTYLKYIELAKRLGVIAPDTCQFCSCGASTCSKQGYQPRDAERSLRRRADMREFDARVKTDCMALRTMYN